MLNLIAFLYVTLTATYRIQSNDADLLPENYQYADVQFNSSLSQVIMADSHMNKLA